MDGQNFLMKRLVNEDIDELTIGECCQMTMLG